MTDIFTLQKMGGWRSFQVMRRYLDQDDTDTRTAHEKSNPVVNWEALKFLILKPVVNMTSNF